MADQKVNHLGTWKDTKRIYANDGGVWKDVNRAYIKDGGSWVEYYRAIKGSCKEYLDNGYNTDGIYTIDPTNSNPFDVYCDMTTDGGGWTLVWTHLKDSSPWINMTWTVATSQNNYVVGTLGTDKTAFQSFIGLGLWNLIGGSQLRYEWSLSGSTIHQRAVMQGNIGDTTNNFKLQLTSSTNTIGTIEPGLFSYHNNRPLTTYDNDNDEYSSNCSDSYNQTAWWYGKCWSGNLHGGGGESTHTNGAFWTGSSNTEDTTNGTGGGNGWIYIR